MLDYPFTQTLASEDVSEVLQDDFPQVTCNGTFTVPWLTGSNWTSRVVHLGRAAHVYAAASLLCMDLPKLQCNFRAEERLRLLTVAVCQCMQTITL